jgi:hypothetical protein
MILHTAKVLLDSQLELKDVLYHALDIYMVENNLHSLPNQECEDGMLLQVYNSLAIAVGIGERFGDWPMYIRCTNNFFGAPWYSSIAIQMEGDGDVSSDTCFGGIRLLFKLKLSNENNEILTKELALVKMYEELPQNRISKLIDCIELRWCEGYCLVIEIGNILRAIHVMPNFTTLGRFFINAYKF